MGLPSLDAIEFDWIDKDTFQVSFGGGSDLNNIVFSLTDLNFTNGGSAADIIRVDHVRINEQNFDAFETIIGPDVGFTANSISLNYEIIPSQLASDFVTWTFDVTAITVPIPPALLLFASGLGIMGLHRRKQI